MKYKHPFTMVEILLALGVCAIGICSIMVLFPIGANASRDAAMETYAANAADQMLNYLKYEITSDNDKWLEYIQGQPTATSNTLDNINPSGKEISPYDLLNTATVWQSTPLGTTVANNVFQHKDNKGVYQILSCRNATPDVTSSEVDFRAIMNVWQRPVVISSTVTLPDLMAIQLNVEVSWPASLPYAARQKSLYVLEFFNPSFTP